MHTSPKSFVCAFAPIAVFVAATVMAPSEGRAQTLPGKTIGAVTPSGPVPSLFVVNAGGATLGEGKLTLTDVAGQAIVFADRPVRAAGHVTTAQFVEQWGEGRGSFAADPPNATISVLGADGTSVSDAVVVLRSPALGDGTLTFDVAVLEGSVAPDGGPAALFIDTSDFDDARWADPARYRGDPAMTMRAPAASYWQAPVLHGAWYRQPEGQAIMQQREDEMDAAGARIMP